MLHFASLDVLVKYKNSSIMNHSIIKCESLLMMILVFTTLAKSAYFLQ